MTTTITVAVGSTHKPNVFAQKERWVPEKDNGSSFTPGAWEDDGEVDHIEAGQTRSFASDAGQSVKIWEEAQPEPEA